MSPGGALSCRLVQHLHKLFAVLVIGTVPAAGQTPAFPGALGFGASATGGRGGNVYHVTNLNDAGAGSFRNAVSVAGRTVVFDVGGYITLSSEAAVKSNITIAGQTAPGGGIAIRGAEVTFGNQSNAICRFVRFRPGGDSNTTDNGLSLYQAKNIILDHCSIAFAKWNNIDAVSQDWQNKPVNNITVQNCLIANPIYQQFGAHTECVEGTWFWLGNLFASGHNRQPLAKIHTIFVNNTIYNYSAAYTTHTSTPFKHDIVNNYFIGGPASAGTDNTWFQVDKNQSIYYAGNYKDRDRDGTLDGSVTAPYWYQGTGTILATPWSSVTTATPTLSAANAVVRNNCDAGPLPRDEMDALVISQVKTLGLGATGRGAGTAGPDGGLYTSQSQTGLAGDGYGVIAGGTVPVDSDRDGMPDDWETAKSLNPANAADGKVITASGYSNLEEYLNWLALPHAFVPKNTAVQPTFTTVDLRKYAEGFPAGAVFNISAITGGAVTQTGTGGYDAKFTPALNTSGIGSFTFSVTSGGYTFSKAVGVLISPNAPPRHLRWKGDGTVNAWNSSALNWTNTGTGEATAFGNGDRVTMDDSGSNTPAIALTGTLSPGYMEKAGLKNYTLSGPGSLSGPMSLTVNGAGSLTLTNTAANLYAGGTFIQDSTLILGGGATPGSGPVTFTGSGTLTSSYAAGTTLGLSGNMNIVDEGDTATINLSAKTALGGGLGGGTVNIKAKGTAGGTSGNYFNGAWSGFTGVLNVTGTVAGAQCDLNINGGGFDNFGAAVLNLDYVKMQSRHNSGGNTIAIGALNGTATATLGGSGYAGGATYEIGARNEACVFSGALTDGVSPTTVTKTGSSSLHLAGPHTYTGPTNVLSGTLYADGAFKGLLNVTGGSLSPRSATDVVGRIQANGGLTLDDATLSMDLASTPASISDKVTCPTGTTLTLNGTNTFRIKFKDGFLSEGIYPLVDGNATLVREAGVVLNVTSPLPEGSRQTLQVVRNSSANPVPAYVNLVVTGTPAILYWQGANQTGTGVWDVASSQSWSRNAMTDQFYQFDFVEFDDATFGVNEVTLVGSLMPRGISVFGYYDTLVGTIFQGSGTLDGTGGIYVGQFLGGRGYLGILNIGANTFSGGTFIERAAVGITNTTATPLGTGTVTLKDGGQVYLGTSVSLPNPLVVDESGHVGSSSGNVSLVSDPANALTSTGVATVNFSIPSGICTIQGAMSAFTGTINMGTSNGMLRLNGTTNANFGSSAAHFDLGIGNATLTNRNGGLTVEFGALSGGANTTLQGRQSGSGATASNYLVGALNTDAVFAGRIVTGGDTNGLNITKLGTGNWTLSGTSSYTGDMTVQAGWLTVGGSLTNAGDFTVRTGATLSLTGGTITTPTLEIESGATVDGCGTINGDIVNHGTLRVNCPGGLTLNGIMENHGLVIVTNRSRIVFNGTVENSGTLDFIGSSATTLPAGFTNTGTLLDASTVKVESVARSGSTLTLTIQTYAGHTYELHSGSLLTGTWSPVTGGLTVQTNAAGLRTFTVSNLPAGRLFFRVAVGP